MGKRSLTGIPLARLATHGDFTKSAALSQSLKATLRNHRGWQKLPDAQREALEMDCFKTARILCGDHDHVDHWLDKMGYAQLGARACKGRKV